MLVGDAGGVLLQIAGLEVHPSLARMAVVEVGGASSGSVSLAAKVLA